MRQLTAAAAGLAHLRAVAPGGLTLSALAFLCSQLLVAQEQPQRQQPTFRTGVELVTVDVVVTDDDDRPITDLAIEDFEIRQNGRIQTIADFAFMGTPVMARDVDSATEIDVPDFSDGEVKMGGLVIGSGTRRSPPIASPTGLQALLPFQPTLAREFATAETLRVFTRLRWDIHEGEPTVSVTLRGDATVITRDAAMVPLADDPDESEREGTVDNSIALADVPPGSYVLEVTATLATGDSVSRRVALKVRR